MGKSTIEWTDATWPIVQGCNVVSPGCTNCYAVPLLWRLAHNPNPKVSAPLQGLVQKAPTGSLYFTGEVALRHDRLPDPILWRKPSMIFVPSHGDIFHPRVPFSFLDKIFAVMAITPWHTYQVLTKRPERMKAYMLEHSMARSDGRGSAVLELARKYHPDPDSVTYLELLAWPPPNVWMGISAEDQQRFNERWPYLRDTPAALRFLSYEPALGVLDPTDVCNGAYFEDALRGTRWHDAPDGVHAAKPLSGLPKLDWAIAGLESGPGTRARDISLLRDFVKICQRARTPVFVKQLGSKPLNAPGVTGKGRDMAEWPEDLRIREFPQPRKVEQ